MKLPAASVVGIGAVTPLGRDLELIAQKLTQAPASEKLRRVDDALLADPLIGRRMRRADRFAKMAAVAALDAWSGGQSACAGVAMDRVGLIISTGFGPHGRGFRFLDGILDCGDSAALPTDFSHSVHGAAAAYITELLDLRGPAMTHTDFEIGFSQAVLMAQCWLAEGTCDRVLVGAVEELGEVMIDCASRMLNNDAGVTPGEGAVFLTLAPSDIAAAAHVDASTPSTPSTAIDPAHANRFTPHFGHSASSAAFELLAALLTSPAASIDNVATFTPSSRRQAATLLLRKM
jgi:3-oxoacyl-(acyl-carrier-protein) synthase